MSLGAPEALIIVKQAFCDQLPTNSPFENEFTAAAPERHEQSLSRVFNLSCTLTPALEKMAAPFALGSS